LETLKPLKITHPDVTPEKLIKRVSSIPGARAGFRIAGLILILKGCRVSSVADMVGVSRQTVTSWIRLANAKGLACLEASSPLGRPPRITEEAALGLKEALQKDPGDLGLEASRWNGDAVSKYLKKFWGIEITPKQGRNWLKKVNR
jgi:transposase